MLLDYPTDAFLWDNQVLSQRRSSLFYNAKTSVSAPSSFCLPMLDSDYYVLHEYTTTN